METREQHLNWCKERALAILNTGDIAGAYASMASDLRKHPETEDHIAIGLGMSLMFGGHLNTTNEMRKFIEGFN